MTIIRWAVVVAALAAMVVVAVAVGAVWATGRLVAGASDSVRAIERVMRS